MLAARRLLRAGRFVRAGACGAALLPAAPRPLTCIAGSIATATAFCAASKAQSTASAATHPSAAAAPGLVGKRALIFGGTSGIGLAAAIRLRDAGAHVTVISRSGTFQADGADVSGIDVLQCDVQDRAALQRLFGRLSAPADILISSATGGPRCVGPFLSMDMDGFQASFAKLWGYANVIRLGAPHVAEGGCIVLVSGAPARKPKAGQASLSSVGAAVEQLTRTVAPELAARQIRINVVSPGVISTPLFGLSGDELRSKLQAATATNLIPRPGTADEVASAVMFAVENKFVTGTTIDVDGGWLSAP